MSSFENFLHSFSDDNYLKGKQFEKFVKWYLENDPREDEIIPLLNFVNFIG